MFVNYLGRFGEPVVDVTHRLSMLQNAVVSASRVFEPCDRSDARTLRATGPVPADTRLRAHGLGFAYEGGEQVLHDIGFDLAPGRFLSKRRMP